MDNANMSQGSDKNNSSDDLIAELARLMASDAKGEPESTPSDAAEGAAEVPAPSSTLADEPVELAANVERAAPEVSSRLPEPSFTAPQQPNPSENNAQHVVAKFPVRAEQAEFQQPILAAEQPEVRAEPVAGPRFSPPASDSFSEPPASREAAKDDFDFELPPLKPFGDLSFGDETTDQSRAAEPVFQPPKPQPAINSAPVPYESDVYAPNVAAAPEPAPAPVTRPESAEALDPIAALIAAQLDEADAVQPGMTRSNYSSGQESSFRRAPSQDFGATRSSPSLPKASRDPLDDIESLIGAALRGERGPTTAPNFAEPAFQQPALHEHVAREHAPQSQTPQSAAADTAEAAILAATASMRRRGDEAEFDAFGDTPMGGAKAHVDKRSDLKSRSDRPSKSKPVWQKFAGPAVAAALLFAVGLGVYWVFGTNSQVDGDAPVLSADSSPIKQAPDAASTTDTPSSVVFSDNATNAPDTIERLISRDETADAAGNDVARVITSETSDDGGLANRKVRTVTVRPDGTIVSGDAAVAGGEQLPVERPNVPLLPGSTIVETPVAPTQTAALNTANTGVVAPVPLPRPNRLATTSVTQVNTPAAAITPVLTNTGSSNTNAVDLIANTANRAVNAPVTPVAQPTAPTLSVATGSSAPAYVQLSSQRNPEAAQQSLQRVQSRFASQLGNNALEVQQVDLGERGIYFRVRMPAQSVEAANAVCSDIKSGGGDCFVRTD